MPAYPRYQSKAAFTTQAPSAEAPLDNSGEIAQKVGETIGGTVQDISLKWSNAVDTIQKTVSQANFETGLADIQNRAQNDPNYNNSDQYYKEIEKLKNDSLHGFSSTTAQTQMGIELGYKAKVGQIQVQNLYKKKMIDIGQASTLQLIDKEINNPTDSSLPNIQKLLNIQVSAGLLDHKDAYVLLQKANKELGVNRVNQDLYKATTPEEVDAIAKGITSGAYERGGVSIEPDKKKALLDIAESAKKNTEKKIEAQQTEAITQNRMETLVDISSGKTPIDSLNMKEIAEYDPEFAGSLTKVKDFMVNYNPKLPAKEQSMSAAGLLSVSHVKQMKNYAKSITDTFLQDDNKSLSDFVLRELNKKGDGLTSSVKLAAFVNLAALKAKANNPQDQGSADAAHRFSAIKAAVNFLQASNPYLFPQAVSEFIVKDFLGGASSYQQVMEEARNVLRDKIIERYKSAAKLPSLPNKIVDGEASVEDVSAGSTDLTDGTSSGDYADAPSD